VHIEIDDPVTTLFVLVGLALVVFLIAYGAARLALLGGIDRIRPVFAARAERDSDRDRLLFTLSNVGTAAAYDVVVRDWGEPPGEPLVRTPLLSPIDPLRWNLADGSSKTETETTSGSASVGSEIRWFVVEWRVAHGPLARHRTSTVPVLVPAGSGSAR
jgi:hypothetical protein